MITLSVLVTFYNQENYVDRAFESIFNQIVDFEYEVIVGDDGSSDGTVERVKEWQSKYPKKIQLFIQPREDRKYISGERASGNRYSLLKYVKGKYFIYLDGDDCYCDSLKFQKQVNILEDPNNEDCSCCAHNVNFVKMNGEKTILKTWFKNTGKIKFSYYWWKGYFHPDSLMFRTQNIEQVIDYYHPIFFNDNYITYIFAHMGKIFFLEDVMANYFETESGIWNGESKIVGWLRTLTIYEYIGYLYKKNRIVNYLRFIPLYYMVLKYGMELRDSKFNQYFDIAKECKAQRVCQLRENNEFTKQLLKVSYGVFYRLNAIAKRIL